MNEQRRTPQWHVSAKMRDRAQALRRESTDAERIIWSAVRAHRMNGAKFRRQTPIGPYIADFVCHEAQLVIELDGGQHFSVAGEARDARRDAFLAAKGFRVLRFSNYDVMTNRRGVLETIATAIRGEGPLPNPPPQAGEGTSAPSPPHSDSQAS